jgi:hypothetical protein
MRGTRIKKEAEIYATNLATHVPALSQFLLRIFSLSPAELAGSNIITYIYFFSSSLLPHVGACSRFGA